jgi:hypothetical protein
MFGQLIRILETGEPTIFKVLQPLDNARGNILIFRFGRGRSFLKDSLCGSHRRGTISCLGYKGCEGLEKKFIQIRLSKPSPDAGHGIYPVILGFIHRVFRISLEDRKNSG